MEDIESRDLLSFKVEHFAHLMMQKRTTFKSLERYVHHAELTQTERENVMQRLRYAKERMEKPLDLDQTILFIIFPFGVVNRLYKNDFFSVHKELKLGYVKKVKEFRLYSLLGLAFYFILGLMILLIR